MILIACYHPAFIQRSIKLSTGDVSTKFLGSWERVSNIKEVREALQGSYNGQKVPDFIPRSYQNGEAHDFIQIPCGKCIGCRMDYSRSWADRMTYHVFGKEDCSWFLTLTYDDDHLFCLDHSENYDLYALDFDHMTKFIRKLRDKFTDLSLDYFYSGEYGSDSFRPHFHMILYNCNLWDLKFWKLNDTGDPIYTSEIVSSLWGYGFVTISPFSWRGAAYTAAYVEKKRDGRARCEYTAVGLTPESCRMSRRPGIAYDYYTEHFPEIWQNVGMNVSRSVNSSGHLGVPRYFRKLAVDKGIGTSEFYAYQERALDRSNILNQFKVQNGSFDLDRISEMLAFEEREILSTKKLR